MKDVNPRMYSPAERPSRFLAAPAKNLIWSTIGGISSDVVRASGLPVFFEARAEELVAAESKNTGKPLALTTSEEIPPMVDQIRFFAGAARNLEGRSAGEYMRGFTSFVRREPIGVCAAVTPWNYPMMMAVWKFAPALAAGNTMVLKPSDTTPVTTLLLAELMSEHLPHGVF